MSNRLPPGQYETEKWPVLHYGSVPRFDPARWDFRVFGEVASPVRLAYDEFMALPKTTLARDIHCATAWSKFGVTFEGVPARTVLELAGPKASAKFVTVHSWLAAEARRPTAVLLEEREVGAGRRTDDPWKEERYSNPW